MSQPFSIRSESTDVTWTRRSWLATCGTLAASSLACGSIQTDEVRGPITAVLNHGDELLAAQDSTLWLLDAQTLEVRGSWQLPMLKCQRLLLANSPSNEATARSLLIAGGDPGERGVALQLPWPEHSSNQLEWTKRVEVSGDVFNDLAIGQDESWWIATRDQRLLGYKQTDSIELNISVDDRSHSGSVTRVVVLESGEVVSASRDQSLRVRVGDSGELLRELHQHVGGIVDLIPLPASGRLAQLASLGLDRTLRVWQPTIGRMVRFVKLPVTPVVCASLENSMNLIVVGEDGSILEVDAQRASITNQSPASQASLYCVSNDGNIAGGSLGMLQRLDRTETTATTQLPS